MPELELDYMEYATDALARAAFVSNGEFLSVYPTLDAVHVIATSYYAGDQLPYFTADPGRSLTGSWGSKQWIANANANQRYHIDLGSAKVINRIYYENSHNSGSNTNAGAQNFTFWGSNEAADFADLVYGNDGTWVQLTTAQSAFAQHSGTDAPDPKYIEVTNITAYRYYAFKFANNFGDGSFLAVRRIELQVVNLLAHAEGTIKVQGSYSLKGTARASDSLNKTLTRTVSPVINLSDKTILRFDMRASRTGSNIKIGIHDSGGTTTEITPNIVTADTWQMVVWDISAVANANKDTIDSIVITILNADADNTFYLDNLFGDVITNYLTSRARNRFKFSGISLG